MHSIVGDKTIPTYFALFGPKPLPSKVLRQGSQLFFYPQVHWNFERGSMNFLVEPIAPESGLVIEMINIAKANTRPEAIFDNTHTSLHFAFRLWCVRLANPCCYPNARHKIGKDGIPFGSLAIHFQDHTLH